MKTIKVVKWMAKTQDGKEVEETTLSILNFLLSNKKPEEMPRGIDHFRLFSRLAKAFEEAEKTDELVLEETDYEFLKKSIEKDIPSSLGMNKSIVESIDNFFKA